MKPKESVLKLVKLAIIDFDFETIIPEKEEKLPDISLDVDFDIYQNEDKKGVYKIELIIKGNKEKRIPGYSFSTHAVGIFSYPTEITEKEGKQLIQFSGLPIVINYVRNYLINLTSYGAFGQYTMPTFDIRDLFQQKKASINKTT